MPYTDGYWWSNDGLRLHYRDHEGPNDRAPLLCIGGLTRNARDFERLAERVSPARRVIAVDCRGRGDSAYAADPMSYVPLTYLHDIERLIDELSLTRFVAVGNSVGGAVAMLLGAAGAARLAGIVLNDIGPVIESAGTERIRAAVGRSTSWPTWAHAARGLAETSGTVYPGYSLSDWIAMAKRLCRLTPEGRIVADYDKRIAEPFRLPGSDRVGAGGGIDLWPAFDALLGVPMLIVRGERSDVLTDATARAMQARGDDATLVTVPRTGHAPTLDEPEAVAAIDALLARVG